MSSMQHAGCGFMLHCRRHRPSWLSTRRTTEQGKGTQLSDSSL